LNKEGKKSLSTLASKSFLFLNTTIKILHARLYIFKSNACLILINIYSSRQLLFFYVFYLKINQFNFFLCFNVLVLKIKKYYFNIFLNKNILKKYRKLKYQTH
jgi:hypothetical protein